MAEDNKQNSSGKNDKKSPEVRVPPRNWLLWALILGVIPIAFVFKNRTEAKYPALPRKELIELLESGQIVQGVIHYNPQSSVLQEITGKYYKMDAQGTTNQVPFRTKTRLNYALEKQLRDSRNFATV